MHEYELMIDDLKWILKRLPHKVYKLMKNQPNRCMLGGGFIRDCIANDRPSDVDLFAPSPEDAQVYVDALKPEKHTIYKTDNAFTLKGLPYTVQVIRRWTYDNPQQLIESFDFTVAKAAVWFDGKQFRSLCDCRFYPDLAARRLRYTSPKRIEEAGGSMLRVLKFYQRGYRIPMDSLGAVIARITDSINHGQLARDAEHMGVSVEQQTAKIVTGLLREVDPDIDLSHAAHLPSTESEGDDGNE